MLHLPTTILNFGGVACRIRHHVLRLFGKHTRIMMGREFTVYSDRKANTSRHLFASTLISQLVTGNKKKM